MCFPDSAATLGGRCALRVFLNVRVQKTNPGPTDIFSNWVSVGPLSVRRDTNGHLGHLTETILALADISGHSGKNNFGGQRTVRNIVLCVF